MQTEDADRRVPLCVPRDACARLLGAPHLRGGGESGPVLKSRAVGNKPWPLLFPTQLREFARALTELQETETELSEEHGTALKAWEERRACLEGELRSVLAEKVSVSQKPEWQAWGCRRVAYPCCGVLGILPRVALLPMENVCVLAHQQKQPASGQGRA